MAKPDPIHLNIITPEHAFYDGICTFSVVIYFFKIIYKISSDFFYFSDVTFINFINHFLYQLNTNFRKIIYEI